MTSTEAGRELARTGREIRVLGWRLAAVRVTTIFAAAVVLAWAVTRASPRGMQPGSVLPMLVALLGLGACALAGVSAAATIGAFRARFKAAEVERARGLGRGDLLGALELDGEPDIAPLANLHRDRVASALRGIRGPELLPESHGAVVRSIRTAVPALGIVFLILSAGFIRTPNESSNLAAALSRPWAITFPPPPPPLMVSPPGGEVMRGSAFDFSIVAEGRDRVSVGRRLAGKPTRYDTLDVLGSEAEGRFESVVEPMRFWVKDEAGSVTDTFSVIPLDAATLVDLSISLRFPDYLRRAEEVVRGLMPQLRVPSGTRLDFVARSNHPIRRLGLSRSLGSGTDTVWLEADGARAEGGLVATDSAFLSWLLIPAGRVPAGPEPAGIRLSVVPDDPPEIRLLPAGVDRVLDPDARFPLVIEAADDHGIASVELIWWRESSGGRVESPGREQLLDRGHPRRVVLESLLDLRGAGLLPGDRVAAVAVAADLNPATPPTVTDTLRVGVASLSERSEAALGQAEALADEIRSLEDRAGELATEARDAERRSTQRTPQGVPASEGPQRPDFTTSQEAREMLDEARRIQDELGRNSERLEELREQIDSSAWPDPELQRQVGELQRLFEELRTTGLGDAIAELEDALANMDRNDLRQTLSSLSARSADLSEALNRTLGLMERVILEQSLEAAREAAAEHAARQKREAATDVRDEGWESRQKRMAAETEGLAGRLEELAGRLEAEDAARAARSALEGGEQARTAAGDMRSAATGQAGDTAGEKAQAAAEALDRVERSLETASRQLAEEWGSDARAVVGSATSEALDLAEEESRLAEELRQGQSTEDVATRQAALREGLENLTQTLAEAGRKTALLDRRSGPAAARAGREMEALRQSLSGGAGRRSEAIQRAEAASEALADLAGSLMRSRQAMENASSATGMEEALEMLSRLGREQAGLNGEAGDLLLSMRSGQPVENRLGGLATGQQAVAEGLRQLSEDPASEELAGRPEELAVEAEAISRELGSGILTPETLARQERLFRRLLDAGRSLEQDQPDSNRREAITARPRVEVHVPVSGAVQSGPRYPYPDDASLEGLDAVQRRLVFDYFDRLNRPSEAAVP